MLFVSGALRRVVDDGGIEGRFLLLDGLGRLMVGRVWKRLRLILREHKYG